MMFEKMLDNLDESDNISLTADHNIPVGKDKKARNSNQIEIDKRLEFKCGEPSNNKKSLGITNFKGKKNKRQPWNIELLKDRFTAQPFQIQLTELCLSYLNNEQLCLNNANTDSNSSNRNILVLMQNEELKNYLKLMILKEYKSKLNECDEHKCFILVTNMGSNVSKYVEFISRHINMKIAGIDSGLMHEKSNESYLLNLKQEADILIMSINTFAEWLFKSFLHVDEMMLVIFDEVSDAFQNKLYEKVMSRHFPTQLDEYNRPKIIAFGSLNISNGTTAANIKSHIEHLKSLFKCGLVEAGTDLIDTHNIFYGYEPNECIQICESFADSLVNSSRTNNQNNSSDIFQMKLVQKIKSTYLFLEELNAMNGVTYNSSTIDNLPFINQLCVRVLNECVYLINEVGVWCLAKSLLSLSIQLDKLATYIHSSNEERDDTLLSHVREENGMKFFILNDSIVQQQLILQLTSTCLRQLREMCIKQFLAFKSEHQRDRSSSSSPSSIDLFLNSFSTKKVNSFIDLLRKYATKSDEFCCLTLVQNKQVAISLTLLLKKLAREEANLSFIQPNYIIGNNNRAHSNQSSSTSPNEKPNGNLNSDESNHALKQEEILRKFYSGEINLLICTYEMEQSIHVPSCVNLIVRFNCAILGNEFTSSSSLTTLSSNTNSSTNQPTTNGSFSLTNGSNAASHAFAHQSAASDRFLLLDYFSFIRTKSRTHSKSSHCYFFIERAHFDSFFAHYARFKQIEHTLMNDYSQLIKMNKSVRTVDAHFKRELTLSNAIYYVNKYCIRLPSDALTLLAPRVHLFTRSQSNASCTKQHKCVLYLPINSGHREAIESDWESSEEMAKKNVAYRTCLILFKKREVSEMLEPITKELFYKKMNKMDADDEREWSQFGKSLSKQNKLNELMLTSEENGCMSYRPGGNKRRQTYKKRISSYLNSHQLITTQHPCYLYAIKCSLITPLRKEQQNGFDASTNEPDATGEPKESSKKCFGLLLSKMLLETVDFSIFTQSGEESVSVELFKSSFYLTPNQLKLVKSFHKFLFSNVLRMEGRGATASPFLLNLSHNVIVKNQTTRKSKPNGYYVTILDETKNDFDWDMMKSVENCTDRSFMKVPNYTRTFANEQNEEDGEEIEQTENTNNEANSLPMFEFKKERYQDAVVIPYYRNTELAPQFYCVSSVDFNMSPLSPFPLSSANSPCHYETFYHYFAIKYNIMITNLTQPLLVVSHPSTRLNLLTPRYMNLKASVLQKSYLHATRNNNSKSSEKKASSSQIYLIPELVNVHPFSASIWRRCLCLPSILYRLNSLLLVEELRREIARSTGVGEPWISEHQHFDKLSFKWDTKKEIEISNVPDVEIDVATIQKNETFNSIAENNQGWDFEISVWDNSCLKETKPNKKSHLTEMIGGESKLTFIDTQPSSNTTTNTNGWFDSTNQKTFLIDLNDMDLFGDGYIDEDEEEEEAEQGVLVDHSKHSKNERTASQENYSNSEASDSTNNIKFTIDLNTLKADMKKKSAKLLSKLGNSGNLVKQLAKNDTIIEQNEPTLQLVNYSPNSNHQIINTCTNLPIEDFNLTNNVFDQHYLSVDHSLHFSLDSTQYEKFCNEIRGNLESFSQLKSQDLNGWFHHVTFLCDTTNGDDKKALSKLIDFIKQKQQVSLNEYQEQSIKAVETERSRLIDCEKQTKLPLKQEEADHLLEDIKLSAEESVTHLLKKPARNLRTNSNSSSVQSTFRNTDWKFTFSLDASYQTEDLSNQPGPGPALLLQALTLSNANDGFDLERLETVGDSFIKQAITVYLFFTYPDVHEGKLSYLRSKLVSNYNLYKLGKQKGIHELIVSSKFEPLESWLPSHYESLYSFEEKKENGTIKTTASLLLSSLLSDSKQSKTQKGSINDNLPVLTHTDKYQEHVVSDKSIADCVEAIIGAYLITSGPRAALQVMSWFGLQVLPKAKCEDGSEILIDLPQVPQPKINDPFKLHELLDGFSAFEACIGYKFKQPVYLLQAFTHTSYTYNTLTDCYQRLEFLGDAILDYVITRFLYEDNRRHSPGELTDLRSALVNNNIFAYLAVKFEFYKYFKYFSPNLFAIIENFVRNQKSRNDEFDLDEDFLDFPVDDEDEVEIEDCEEVDDLITDDFGYKSYTTPAILQSSTNELEEMEVPKCLGDIFESVAGAIFLDSNKSFDTVWRVYYGLMKPYIEKYTTNVPKSPIRELLELEPETAKFEKPQRTLDGKIRVVVSIFGKGKYKGVGRNYRIAKNAAAKLALQSIKSEQ